MTSLTYLSTWLSIIFLSHFSIVHAEDAKTKPVPKKASDLFQESTVWTVHLKFTPEQWKVIEPKRGKGNFGPFGQPNPTIPKGPIDPPKVLSPSIMRQADQNRDNQLSKDEVVEMAGRWFDAWDKNNKGKLTSDQLRDGLNMMLIPPGFGPPSGRSMGMNLQGPEGKRNGVASMMGIDFQNAHADLEFEGQAFQNVSVRYKGGGTFLESQFGIKRSLKIDLNKHVKDQKLAEITTLNLANCITDPSWMNEVLSYRLFRDAKVPAPRTAYARVYVTVPNKYERKYFGLYSLVENIDNDLAQDRFGTKEGAIFKPVTNNLFFDLGDDWKAYKQTYDPKAELSDKQKKRMMDLCWLVTQANDSLFTAQIGDYIDLDECARYLAVMVFLTDLDGIFGSGQNFYLHLDPKTNKFIFIAWDQDHSFGQFPRGTQEQREQMSIHKPWDGENRFLDRLFKVNAFKKLYLAQLKEFNQSIFKPERFSKQVDELAPSIRAAVEEESSEKLQRFNKVVAGESLTVQGFGGPQKQVPIKPFVKARAKSLIDQVAGKSKGQIVPGFPDFGFGGPKERPRGPGDHLTPLLITLLDSNNDNQLSREEWSSGFGKWFESWKKDKTDFLTEEQLRMGIARDISLSK